MKLVLASQNPKKLGEMQDILSHLGVEVVLQSALDVYVDVEETGKTFGENAEMKARAVMEATGLPAIGDDSGLAVDALGGKPGIYSARYGGPGLSDAERYRLLLQNMQGEKDRACRFVCAIACCFPDGRVLTAEGTCEGAVGTEPRGEGGFGYDPVFYLPEQGRTMAELTPYEKHQISHRGKALRQFAQQMAAEAAETKPER
ncbi:MAG: XTP/dITP diphosphatase [Oscillospiraceae bacterium]|jgi:XTP/dITP diphosphohydrolase